MHLEQKIANLLIEKKKTLSLAESCTGGLLTHRLTNIPGSSQFLECSIVAYSNASKRKLLKIPLKLIEKYGAVSKETAALMAKNVRKIFKTDFGISITGIAGPTGATKTKPVGLCFVALATAKHTRCLECHFKGNRSQVKSQAATKALKMLDMLDELSDPETMKLVYEGKVAIKAGAKGIPVSHLFEKMRKAGQCTTNIFSPMADLTQTIKGFVLFKSTITSQCPIYEALGKFTLGIKE